MGRRGGSTRVFSQYEVFPRRDGILEARQGDAGVSAPLRSETGKELTRQAITKGIDEVYFNPGRRQSIRHVPPFALARSAVPVS